MLLFSARILADFTQQTIAVRRLPRAIRDELSATSLDEAPHEDLGSRRVVELLLDWICRTQDVGADGRVAAGFEPLVGWSDVASMRCQLASLRAFMAAAEYTGDGVYRRRARRIAATFIGDDLPASGSQPAVDPLLDRAWSIGEEALALQMRTAAQQLFGLGSYKAVIVASTALLRSLKRVPLPAGPNAAEASAMTPLMLERVDAACALFDVARVTRDAGFVDDGLRVLDQILTIERARLPDSGGSSSTDIELPAALCDALLEGYRLSLHNRLLHEASCTMRPIFTALGEDLRRQRDVPFRARYASWSTRDLSLVVGCLQELQTLRHIRPIERKLGARLVAMLRSSVVCEPTTSVHGSLATTVPARGELGAVTRSTEAAALLLTHLLSEQQAERYLRTPLAPIQSNLH